MEKLLELENIKLEADNQRIQDLEKIHELGNQLADTEDYMNSMFAEKDGTIEDLRAQVEYLQQLLADEQQRVEDDRQLQSLSQVADHQVETEEPQQQET